MDTALILKFIYYFKEFIDFFIDLTGLHTSDSKSSIHSIFFFISKYSISVFTLSILYKNNILELVFIASFLDKSSSNNFNLNNNVSKFVLNKYIIQI